jgi:hypothetical protein
MSKEHESITKQLEMISRERDLSQKNFVKSTTASQKQFNILKLSEQAQRTLEQEISGHRDEAQKMRKVSFLIKHFSSFTPLKKIEIIDLMKQHDSNN